MAVAADMGMSLLVTLNGLRLREPAATADRAQLDALSARQGDDSRRARLG
jgi:hypothetical protein